MSDVSGNTDELKKLQSEAAELAELKKGRKRKPAVEAATTEQPPAKGPADRAEQEPDSTEETVQPEGEGYDLADQLETYLGQIEETALERPALALLTTFAFGVIVGHLFTRR